MQVAVTVEVSPGRGDGGDVGVWREVEVEEEERPPGMFAIYIVSWCCFCHYW